MRQFHQFVCRSGLLLVMGLLAGCGTPTLPSANVPPPTLSAIRPAAAAVPIIATALPYPAPYPAPQRPPTNQQAQSAAPTMEILYRAPTLGVVVDPQMRVLSVEVSSAAEAAGVQPGDHLETLDGIPLGSQTQNVKERISTAQADQAMRLTMRRGTTAIEVIVVPFPSHSRSGSTAEPGHPAPTATPVAPPDDYL